MKIWKLYTDRVKHNCASIAQETNDLVYWGNHLFAGTIIYLLPFCLIALIPGIYWSIFTHQYVLAAVDVAATVSMIVIAFVQGFSIHNRKRIFIFWIYTLSIILLYYVGLSGPGLLFLLAAAVFCMLIFPKQYAYWPPLFNTLVCIGIGVANYYALLPWQRNIENSPGAWIAVSSNLVFLSFLSAALIPRLFNGLQETILKEKKLRQQLDQKQESLEATLKMLEHKNAEMEQFAYVASHDLQEPLRMVTGFLTRLDKNYHEQLDERGKQFIHFAVDGAQRMQQIIADLLEFSRVGNTRAKEEPVDLNEMLKEVTLLFNEQVKENKAVIHAEPLPTLSVARTLVMQVFQNLISNALKYQLPGSGITPEVKISAQENLIDWTFRIADNGIGIAPKYFDSIFTIFTRLHSKEEFPGTGIGLAITKKIVEHMGGKIWVTSEPGRGSSFYFSIPKNRPL